ncbi:hypothetical protein COB52_03355 [Candidatus Kaiserbacteria bacterium]|nr:MAG: hypothetical protein COB52_03355 [Candidatus Kaiserbacteria bacterium]
MKFSVIIPTYKREEDLLRCLDSIKLQSLAPDEVIVIDDDSITEVLEVTYYKKDHSKHNRGTAVSRNLGLSLIRNNIFFILDDDLVLDPGFFKNIISLWESSNEKTVGIGGVISNNRGKSIFEKVYSSVFGLTSKYKWDVTSSVFQVWNDKIGRVEEGYYAHGGACSYDASRVRSLGGFYVFREGLSELEDIEFCLRAKTGGFHFLIEPLSKTLHLHSPGGREGEYSRGFREGYNRNIIFQKHGTSSRLAFLWASFGWSFKQLLRGNFRRFFGLIKGNYSNGKDSSK